MRSVWSLTIAVVVLGCGGGSDGGGTGPGTFASLSVSAERPSMFSIAPGNTDQVSAVPKDQSGHTMGSLGAPTFTSSDPTTASVDPSTGLVTAVKAGGPVTITASLTANGVTHDGTATVSVVDPAGSADVAAATTGNDPYGTPDQFAFQPDSVDIAHGGSVTFKFAGVTHNVTFTTSGSPANVPNSANTSVPRTFSTSGVYDYHCTIHGMAGRVVVH